MPPQLVARAKPEIRAKGERGHKYLQTSAFRLLDRDHSRIGFADNHRHGAFMMVTRPRRADRACTLCPFSERPCCRRAAEQRGEKSLT
jgi:hypothetical protein